MGQPDGLEFSREQVGEFVRAAVRVGFAAGESGLWEAAPEPVIAWDDGAPRIVGWRERAGDDGGT